MTSDDDEKKKEKSNTMIKKKNINERMSNITWTRIKKVKRKYVLEKD